MKNTIIRLALLLAPLATQAQTDTTAAPRPNTLELGLNSSEGAFAQVTAEGDTTNKPSPLVITTKRKTYTILTEPRNWASQEDSVADLLKELRTQRRNQFTYWSGVDVGLNMLLGPDGSTEFPESSEFMELEQGNSRFVSINLMEQKIDFGSHHVGLLTGLGWECTSYRLRNNYLLQFAPDSVYATEVETPQYRKNKLRQSGIRVPLMLEFNTKRAPMPTADELMAAARDTVGGKKPRSFDFDNKKNFHIAVGVVGTFYYESMYKQKYSVEGEKYKETTKGDLNMLPYRAAASVRLGYGSLNLFAEYGLTRLFEKNKGPEFTPLNIGLTIIGFN